MPFKSGISSASSAATLRNIVRKLMVRSVSVLGSFPFESDSLSSVSEVWETPLICGWKSRGNEQCGLISCG